MKPIVIAETRDTTDTNFLGVTLTIARANNPKYLERFQKISKAHATDIRLGMLEDDAANEMYSRILAGTILVGWKGLKQEGEEVEFTEENAASLLYHDPEARKHVEEVAGNLSYFLDQKEDELVEKSLVS